MFVNRAEIARKERMTEAIRQKVRRFLVGQDLLRKEKVVGKEPK